jgi:hypothetical protein
MANKSYYLEALIDLGRPATAKDVHAHALQMFGYETILGDRTSCRLSLMRHTANGRVAKNGPYFEPTEAALDPVKHLNERIRELELQLAKVILENNRLKGEV